MTLNANITRHDIAMYLCDAWADDVDEYQDYTNAELIQMLKDNDWYDEFLGYMS